MSDTSSSNTLNPAVLRFRGLDLEAMSALQMRNIDAIRRMTNMMLDSTRTITERQAAFLKASAEQMNSVLEGGDDDGVSDPKAIFERQTDAYRALFSALATHVGELSEMTAKCCSGMLQEASGNMMDLSPGDGANEPAAKQTGPASKTASTKT